MKDRPIAPGSPLAHALDDFAAPALTDGFADRVLARTADRPEPLPELRSDGRLKRWRTAQRLAVGTLAAGALATAAAATGALDSLPINIPTPQEVWSKITGDDEPEPSSSPISESNDAALVPETRTPVEIEGPIDTPEELEEAFRRIDEVRSRRTETRRNRVDQRIENAIDRRREQGLPVPTPEQESRLRERIEEFRERRDDRIDERLEGRRDEMRDRVDGGEELSREEFIRDQRDVVAPPRFRERMERLRELPPEERRERLRQFRERRQERLEQRFRDDDLRPDGSDVPTEVQPEPAENEPEILGDEEILEDREG